jgi:hypothetical protein
MGDMGEVFRALKADRKEQREKYGQECQGCVQNHPNRNPSILFPGQKCRWCGWTDQRQREAGIHK